jgi:hypothetical protein
VSNRRGVAVQRALGFGAEPLAQKLRQALFLLLRLGQHERQLRDFEHRAETRADDAAQMGARMPALGAHVGEVFLEREVQPRELGPLVPPGKLAEPPQRPPQVRREPPRRDVAIEVIEERHDRAGGLHVTQGSGDRPM